MALARQLEASNREIAGRCLDVEVLSPPLPWKAEPVTIQSYFHGSGCKASILGFIVGSSLLIAYCYMG